MVVFSAIRLKNKEGVVRLLDLAEIGARENNTR
jgi:hypothetical protein